MTDTKRYRRTLDPDQALMALRPAFMELGIREISAFPDALVFKIGCGSWTAWVELSLNDWDLYDLEIFKRRSGKIKTLRTLNSLYWDVLAAELIAAWCDICTGTGR